MHYQLYQLMYYLLFQQSFKISQIQEKEEVCLQRLSCFLTLALGKCCGVLGHLVFWNLRKVYIYLFWEIDLSYNLLISKKHTKEMFDELLQHPQDFFFLNIENEGHSGVTCAESKKILCLQDRKKASKKKHWKADENKRYAEFLKENKDLFQKDREDKRLIKINILMSEYVKSKNSTQCRSHHQKMLLHYKTIQNIIANLCSDSQIENHKKDMFSDDFQVVLEKSDESNTNILDLKGVYQVLNIDCWGYEPIPTLLQ